MKRQPTTTTLVVIPAGLMMSCLMALGTPNQAGAVTDFPLSQTLIGAIQNELRTRGYAGEMLASELGLLMEWKDESNHEPKP